MSLEDWLQRANSSESSDGLQGLNSSASYSAPTPSAASTVGLRANESLLMLMIWELTTRSKLDCVLIL